MKKLLLLLILLPSLVFAGASNSVIFHNINDGYHKLDQGQQFIANEELEVTANSDHITNVACVARDSAKIDPVNVEWRVTINHYEWHYYLENTIMMTSLFFPPTDQIYYVEIEASIDGRKYHGAYGYIKCFPSSPI